MAHTSRTDHRRRLSTASVLAALLLAAFVPAPAVALGAIAAQAGVISITVPGVADAVAVDPVTDTAYVAEQASPTGTVQVINLAAGTITATISVGKRPASIAVNPVTNTVYVGNYASHSVSVINGATNAVTKTITAADGLTAGVNGVAVDPVTNMVYVGMATHTGAVVVIDGSTNSIADTITGKGGFPLGVAVDPATDVVYAVFGAFPPNVMLVINAGTNTITDTIPLPNVPEAVAVNPVTNTFYVANYGETVSAYSGVTNVVKATTNVGGLPRGLAVNPQTNTVYATATIFRSQVALIDGTTNAVTGTIGLTNPLAVAADPATDTVVVAGGHTVSVIALQAPAFESIDHATFTAGTARSFAVRAAGTPAPVFSASGRIPAGVTLTRGGTLSGTPAAGTGGLYRLKITASNGVSPAATQAFALTVDQAPAFTSTNHATFRSGVRGSFKIRTSGFPAATVTEKGNLPRGLRFAAQRNGRATILGTPARSARGKTFVIRLIAANGVGHAVVQRFTITVR